MHHVQELGVGAENVPRKSVLIVIIFVLSMDVLSILPRLKEARLMKREIKFRAWDKENQEWTDGHFWREKVHADYLMTFKPSVMEMFHENYELMQFTGLHDKNGKEIYEGDIVRLYRPGVYENLNEVVKFNDGCFDVESLSRTTTGRDYLKVFVANHAIEIIGNILDHPSLLPQSELP